MAAIVPRTTSCCSATSATSASALLLAGVSHDLRSPLARIRMAAALLPGDEASAPWREAIALATLEVADRLIGSFLDQVRAGELPLDQHTDLAAIALAMAARPGAAARRRRSMRRSR